MVSIGGNNRTIVSGGIYEYKYNIKKNGCDDNNKQVYPFIIKIRTNGLFNINI